MAHRKEFILDDPLDHVVFSDGTKQGRLSDLVHKFAAQDRETATQAVQIALPDVWAQLEALIDEPERMHALYLEMVRDGRIARIVKAKGGE